MNYLIAFTAGAASALFLSACHRSDPPVQPATPAAATATEPAAIPGDGEPTAAEKKLAQQVMDLEAAELALHQQLEEERLAATEAEIASEKALLAKEREAWLLEEQLAAAAEKERAAAEAALETPAEEVPVSYAAEPSGGYDYQTFYDELAPLGTWYDYPEYGYVWQPAVCVVDTSWRPYMLGRWACCDHGWAWCSDEPFGWACYHYGRWACVHDHGWIWVPGEQWAPAWVCWRRNEDYVGWCPLPPETVFDRDCSYGRTVDHDCGIHPGSYLFVAARHFDGPIHEHCESAANSLKICRTTINITDLTSRRSRVYSGGPKQEWVAERIGRPVSRYTLALASDKKLPGHRIENDRLTCRAPKVSAPWNRELRPPQKVVSLAGAQIVRSESGLPDRLESSFRYERQHRAKTDTSLTETGKKIIERQRRIAGLEETRQELHGKLRPEPSQPAMPATIAAPATPSARPQREVATARENPALTSARAELAQMRAQRESKRPAAPVVVAADPATKPVLSDPANQIRLEQTRAELNSRREQLERLRVERQQAQSRKPAPVAATAPDSPARNAASESRLREQQEQVAETRKQLAQQRAALEQQRRETDAAIRESGQQNVAREAFEDRRREQLEAQNEGTKKQFANQGVAVEDGRRQSAAASRELENQNAARVAMEERRQQQEELNERTKQDLFRQRTALEDTRRRQQEAQVELAREQSARQREAQEQQRRQAEADARAAELAARQREAMDQQRRQAEAESHAAELAARQREAMEQQRRQAEAESRAAEQSARQREAMEQQHRRAEAEARAAEQARRQAEEHSQRQAEEQNRRQQDEQRTREAADRASGGRKR